MKKETDTQTSGREYREAFWEIVAPEAMTLREWEALCDHCGQCCLQKLEDEETGTIYHTNIACRMLDIERCMCKAYHRRLEYVPRCLQMTPERAGNLDWLPPTCAYRLLAQKKPLKWWHPLISKDPETVHQAGISVRGKVISETAVDPDHFEDYIIDAKSVE